MQIVIDELGRFAFYVGVASLISIVVHMLLLLIFHFVMPQTVLDKYFKPPYFRDIECLLFTGIPYAPIRTIMFMRLIAYPGSGKARGINDAHLFVPRWYRAVSKIMIIFAVANMLGILLSMLGAGVVYLWAEGS
jgi:uncharacterized membrane protein YwzB